MSEYIPKYPSQEGDDSNKSSSELLAETLKPIYVPQDLMLAWESHLASYSRDTNVLLDQVKDSELALNTQYQVLLARVQKYEQMLQDITMDSNEFTMDTDEVNFTGWNILAQASYWDYLLRKEITKLSDQIKSTKYKGGLISEVTDAVLEGLIADNTYISNVIGALSDTPLIRELDEALTSTVTSITDLQAESVRLAEKQAADAAAFADQQEEMLGQLVTSIEASKAEQLNRLAEEAAIRTQLLQELEAKTDAITADYNAVVDTLHTTVIQELTTMQDGVSASVSELKTADEAIITSLDAYKVSNGQNIAALQNSVNVVTNTQESIATQVTGLIASFDQIDLGLSKAQADIITSNQARADGDAALSQQITTINTGLGDANSRIDIVNTAVSTLDAATATKFSELATTLAGVDDSIASVRQIADTAVSNDTAQATEINALKSRMTVTELEVISKADASALSSLNTRVGAVEGKYTSQATDITKLSNSLDTTNVNVGTAQTAAQNAMNAAGAKGKVIFGNTVPLATDRLVQNLWIDTTGNANTPKRWDGSAWVVVTDKVATDAAKAVSDLDATVKTKADVTALNSLTTKVTDEAEKTTANTNSITTLNSDIVKINNDLATKASASALNSLTTRVATEEGKSTSQGNQITKLTNDLATTNNKVNTKADATAVQTLDNKVTQQGTDITSQGSSITKLQSDLTQTNTNVSNKADSSALTALDNKVTAVDGRVTATNSAVTNLTGRVSTVEGAVATKAEATALSAITTRVTNAEGVNTSQGSAITTLENTVNHATTGLATKASSAALTTLDSKVTAIDGRVTSNSSSITTLNNSLTTTNTNVATAQTAAENAMTAAGQKGKVIFGSTAPVVADRLSQNLWIDTTGNTNTPKRWNGSAWVVVTDKVATDALAAANAASSLAATKADSSALTALDSKVTTIDGKVSTNASNITTLQGKVTTVENGLATKAEGSALSALTTRVSNAEGGISTQSSKTTALEAKISSFKAAGRNYLRDSKAAGTKSINPEINTILAPSTPIRMSFDIEIRTPVQAGSNNRIGFECNFNISGTAYYFGVWLANASSLGAGKRRVYTAQMLPSSWTAGVSSFPSTFPYYNQTSGGDFTVSNIKLEVGDAYTDWTPAPEDNASASALSILDTKVTSIDGKVTTHASSITQLQADVSGNSSKLIVQGDVVDGLKASYVVKTDVNGLVAGYGLYNTGSTAAFGVNADYFYVGKQSDNKKPFLVLTSAQTIDGITYPAGTWINTAIIANATIGTAHIKDAAITTAKIQELDASKITTGVLNANRIRVGPTSTFDDGYNPASKARTFVAQPTVPYSVGDIWKNGTSTYICKTQRVAGSFTAAEWDKVGDVTSENTALDVVNVNGVSAAIVATNAATGKTLSDNIMSDLIITPVEKSGLLNEWNRIKAEYTNIVTQGTATGVSTATLTTNYNALNGIVPRIELDILASMTTHYIMTTVNRDAFKAKLKLYFDTAEATAKDITSKVNGIAASKAKTYITQPLTPYTAGDIWKSGTSTYICITRRDSGAFSIGDWVKVGDVTSENTAANSNQLGGTPAATINTNIANADSKATTANNQVNAWKFTGTTKIDGGNIQADTVTAAQISVNDLSAISANLGTIKVGSANIADLAVTTAKIGEAQITTSKIGDLQVDTLKIKDNAVTIGVSVNNSKTISIQSSGGKVLVTIGVQARFSNITSPNTFTLKRNGTNIHTWQMYETERATGIDGTNFFGMCGALPPFTDSPPAGTHTYELHTGVWDPNFIYTSMSLMETKK